MIKNININKGKGSDVLISDIYNVTSDVDDYDDTTLTPNEVEIKKDISNYDFKISANGKLTLYVRELNIGLNPISGAQFKRTDEDGIEYGDIITTDENGYASFDNVPYGNSTIYFKQVNSDDHHYYFDYIRNHKMESIEDIHYIFNIPHIL